MKEYKGRRIRKQISARLMPGNSGLPDCICEILLTEDMLYVLEDDFDGKYTTHYAIPCRQIDSIEKCRYTEHRNTGGDGMLTPSGYALTALIGVISGFIFLPNKKSCTQSVCSEYLKIMFVDEMDVVHRIYFNEIMGNMKGFSKAFRKVKGGPII